MTRPPTQQEVDYGCALERPRRKQELRAMLILIITWAAVAAASAFVAWELTP